MPLVHFPQQCKKLYRRIALELVGSAALQVPSNISARPNLSKTCKLLILLHWTEDFDVWMQVSAISTPELLLLRCVCSPGTPCSSQRGLHGRKCLRRSETCFSNGREHSTEAQVCMFSTSWQNPLGPEFTSSCTSLSLLLACLLGADQVNLRGRSTISLPFRVDCPDPRGVITKGKSENNKKQNLYSLSASRF